VAAAERAPSGGAAAAQSRSSDPPVNFAALKGVCSEDEAKELLQLFLCSTRTIINQLETALQSYDVNTLKTLSQQLRTACVSMGANELATIAGALERDCESEQWAHFRLLLAELRRRYSAVQDYTARFWRKALA
jgi:HPt (histidine-containing phosphotransfer) domain-containing protein